ncbi:MAG: tetratricopeptide repeat protein [Tepidisphaeraceae bacterium]
MRRRRVSRGRSGEWPVSGEAANSRRWRADAWICAGLIALVLAVYLQTVDHDFLGYDDPFYVTDNPIVQRGLTWEGVRWAFSRSYEAGGTYAPFTFLTHMLDCQLYGLRPGGHHLTNVVLHAANSVALYLGLLALTRGRWPSALAAALFAVHPLRVESVAWVAERKDLVCGFFFMLCLWAYAGYARRPGVGWYLLVILVLALGLMSKPMLVTVPALLLLLDCWPLKRPARWKMLVIEKVPMVVMSLATAVLTVATQRSAGFVRTLDQFPLEFRISNTIVSYVRYVGKTIWPFNLASFYPPPAHWAMGTVAGGALVLVLITVVAVATMRRSPYLAVGWFWFLGTLVPVIGLVQVGRQAMADRYSYIPQIGLFIAAAWAAAAIAKRSTAAKQTVVSLAAVALIALTIRAANQTRHWESTETLAAHALLVTENNNVALVWMGNARRRAGDVATAEAMYRQALSIDPDYGMAHLNLGNLLALRREFREAADHFEAAIRWRPQLERAHLGLGIARTGLRQYDLADESFREALRLAPRLADARTAWDLSRKQRAATTAPATRGAAEPH